MEGGDTDSSNKNAANVKNQLINHEREKPIPAKRSIHSDSRSGSGDSIGKGSHKTGGGASDQRAGSKPLSPSPRSGGAGSSQLTSVGYISGDKPTNSHVWSKHSSSDDSSHHSNSDSVYYNKGSNFGDSNKIKSNNYHSSITAALDTLKDEILYSTQVNGMNEFHIKTVSELVSGAGNAAIGVTGNVGNQQLVFMEGRNGRFVPTTRSAALKNSCSSVWLEKVSDLDLQTPLDQAILVQKIFTPLAIISSGLLGGVALMQLFMSYSFMKQNCENCDMNDNFTFIESYNTFAKVAPTAFYILLAICVVAIFDRFDLAHLDIRHCSDTLSYRHGWILLIVYLLTLLITLWAAELDDMLLLYPHDKSFAANQQQMISLLSEWHRLNICRCILAILGWVILALSQPDDLLLCHLKSIKQFDAQPKKILVVGSPSTINSY